jgi:hypothetical protein
LLHRFRNKDCAIRRDWIYSLLALCKEGRNLQVNYNVSDKQLFREVLELRQSSICLCSVAIVRLALGPWNITPSENDHSDISFAEMHMDTCALTSTACLFCSNWVPFLWTKKRASYFVCNRRVLTPKTICFWNYHPTQKTRISPASDPHQSPGRSIRNYDRTTGRNCSALMALDSPSRELSGSMFTCRASSPTPWLRFYRATHLLEISILMLARICGRLMQDAELPVIHPDCDFVTSSERSLLKDTNRK